MKVSVIGATCDARLFKALTAEDLVLDIMTANRAGLDYVFFDDLVNLNIIEQTRRRKYRVEICERDKRNMPALPDKQTYEPKLNKKSKRW